jgi:hypothetical protein
VGDPLGVAGEFGELGLGGRDVEGH